MLLDVRKMTCNHCVRAVTAAVHARDPGATIEVDLARGTVRIDGGTTDASTAAEAIREAGYEVEVLEQ